MSDFYGMLDEGIGRPGNMLSGTKDRTRFPLAVWNANVCTRRLGKVWFGDLDLGSESTRETLQAVASAIREEVYVLREMDARFDTEEKPKFESAVEVFKP